MNDNEFLSRPVRSGADCITSVRRICVAAALLAFLSGCAGGDPSAGPPASVSGTVTWQGQPLENGSIRFEPDIEVRSPGAVVPVRDGKYEVGLDRRLVAGEYTVRISGFRKTGRTYRVDVVEEGQPEEQDEYEQFLPPKHNTGSNRMVTLEAGSNTHDFTLD